mgnify:CR=1 FL=1
MFRAGAFVADHVTPIADEQVQPNGVDLTAESVLRQVSPGRIGRDGKSIGEREPVPAGADAAEDGTVEATGSGDAATWRLSPGAYVLQYAETVRIPEGHVGFIYPRSSLMRNAAMLHTAVWDAGYEGRGEGLLEVHHDLELERGARVGQLVLARGDHETTYDGSYQGERTG